MKDVCQKLPQKKYMSHCLCVPGRRHARILGNLLIYDQCEPEFVFGPSDTHKHVLEMLIFTKEIVIVVHYLVTLNILISDSSMRLNVITHIMNLLHVLT